MTAEEPAKGTVFLVHGLGRTRWSMIPAAMFLERSGFAVRNIGYPSRRMRVERLAEAYLAPELEKAGDGAPVHFVTHSMGGILVRELLQHRDLPPGGRVVMMAPPNQGSELVDRLREFPIFRWRNGPAGAQLGIGPDSLPNRLMPVDAAIGVIAGNRCLNPLFGHWIDGPCDGKVSVSRARLGEMADFLVLPVSHTFMMLDRRVLFQTRHFLRHGRFRRQAPRPRMGNPPSSRATFKWRHLPEKD